MSTPRVVCERVASSLIPTLYKSLNQAKKSNLADSGRDVRKEVLGVEHMKISSKCCGGDSDLHRASTRAKTLLSICVD